MKWRVGVAILGVAVAAGIPLLDPNNSVLASQLTEICTFALALVGVNIAVGHAGLLNLGAGAQIGIGAFASAILNTHWGFPVPLAIICGTLVGTAIGLVTVLPALRLGRVVYAMVSLFMAAELSDVLQLRGISTLSGGANGLPKVGALVPLSSVGENSATQAQYGYWIVLAVTAVAFFACWWIAQSRLGRGLRAIKEDEVSARTSGISVPLMKICALTISSLTACLAGALLTHTSVSCVQTCTLNSDTFGIDLSIFLFSALIVGGSGTLVGPILGVIGLGSFYVFLVGSVAGTTLLDQFLSSDIIFGALILAAAVFLPGGLASIPTRLLRRRAKTVETVAPTQLPVTTHGARLAVSGLSVAYGGNRALDGVNLTCEPGTIHALVGANGSGKSTLINVVSGVTKPVSGIIVIDDKELTGGATARARRGIARTFQTPRLQHDASALDNTLVATVALGSSGQDHDAALNLLGWVGLAERALVPASQLTHGERRLVEVARALLAHPRILLLDEPAAGLARPELDRLATVLTGAAQGGCAVVLVEHNLGFVRGVAETATVLDRGRVIADGPCDEVFSHPDVIACFIGEAA